MRRVSTPVNACNSATTGPRVWPSKGLPCRALVCSTNWPPLGLVTGVATDTLQPNSYGALALPLPMHSTSGALPRIDLAAALAVILETYSHRQGEQVGKALLERLVAGDLAPNVADHAAEPGAQKLELTAGALELV